MKLRKEVSHTFKIAISFPTNGYKIDDLLVIDRSRKEVYDCIKDELYHLGCAIGDCCADGLAQTHSINEIIIANLIKYHGFVATDEARNQYLLVKEAKPEKNKDGTANG